LTSALLAAVIDWLIVSAALVLVAFVVMLILLLALPGDDNKIVRIGISIGIVALIPIGKIAYNVLKWKAAPNKAQLANNS
jgi:hypothetical protein